MEDKNANAGTKEEMNREINSQIKELKSYGENLVKLCDQLSRIANGGDAALTAVKDAKVVADEMKGAKDALDKVRKALKTRAQAILKDC